jgi:hypothetical protein
MPLPVTIIPLLEPLPAGILPVVETARQGRKTFIKSSIFIKQVRAKMPDQDPFQFFLSFLSLCIFPFVMRPVFQHQTETDDKKFNQMMTDRKKLIPVWTKAILKAKYP